MGGDSISSGGEEKRTDAVFDEGNRVPPGPWFCIETYKTPQIRGKNLSGGGKAPK